MPDDVRLDRNLPRLIIGVSIVLAGLLFTLDNLRIVHAEHYLSYWPIVLVVIGFAHLVQTSTWGGYVWSLILILVGFWILGENVGLITVSIWKLSPLLLVLLGASMVWRAFGVPVGASGLTTHTDAFIRGTAVMGGIERASDSPGFRGADLVAIMGACKVDLRRASMAGNEAFVDVFAIMGGVELRIPESWTVDIRVLPLMGGATDQTHPVRGETAQRLVIRGTAFMGGVEIKN
jgi:predicted membrane protein